MAESDFTADRTTRARAVAATIARKATAETSRARTVRELRELISALDRRVPHVERSGELSIARAAAALRLEAVKRIDELNAAKADDAAPVRESRT